MFTDEGSCHLLDSTVVLAFVLGMVAMALEAMLSASGKPSILRLELGTAIITHHKSPGSMRVVRNCPAQLSWLLLE